MSHNEILHGITIEAVSGSSTERKKVDRKIWPLQDWKPLPA